MRSDFRFRLLPIMLAGLALLVFAVIAYDYGSRYLSWANLTKVEVVESARWYVRERAPGQKVCLYAVTCDKGRARLVLVKDVNAWDFEAAKQLAWNRRFKDHCPGQTANFALEVAEGGPEISWEYKQAVWAFSLDRFTPRSTRFQGHAFSEKEAEPCTAEYAVAG